MFECFSPEKKEILSKKNYFLNTTKDKDDQHLLSNLGTGRITTIHDRPYTQWSDLSLYGVRDTHCPTQWQYTGDLEEWGRE